MSLVRDLADQIVAAHRTDDLCIPIPKFSLTSLPPKIDNEHVSDHYELAGVLAAVEMGFIEKDALVLVFAICLPIATTAFKLSAFRPTFLLVD